MPLRRPTLLRRASRGQALVEFALVLPLLVLVLLGVMQFGLLFWGQITLTQVARDTGRWAATQQECDTASNRAAVVGQARAIALESSLFAYEGGADPNLTIAPSWAPNATPCPPADNTSVEWVTILMTYRVDVFLPLAADTCTPVCQRTLTTEVQFRMEPEPAP
jgi:Flp pilus assembly protein TadG